MITSLIVLSSPDSPLFPCHLTPIAYISPIITFGPPGDVILLAWGAVASLTDCLGNLNGKCIRAGPRAERNHQDFIPWLGYIQYSRQPDQGCPSIGIANHRYKQPWGAF